MGFKEKIIMGIPITNTSSVDISSCDDVITVTSDPLDVYQLQLAVVKTSSCQVASVGGTIKYCVSITNTTGTALFDLVFKDLLDVNLSYVNDSFTVDGQGYTPTIVGQLLSYEIDEIQNEQEIVICFKVDVNSWPNPQPGPA